LHTKNCHVAAFVHVLTNVFDRFNGITVFYIFVCALNAFNSKGEYGTTHRLSTSMSPFDMCLYPTFMCALNAFTSKGEYGTTHRLSTSMSPFDMCMVANLPPSFTDLLLYEGYPSFPVIVLDSTALGYCLEHFPSIMHGDFGFSVPQGPCIIFLVTTSYRSLSSSASGISAHITSSISSEVIL
ncbi:unnamed protein product, partial [Onchocerca ochengi]